ncbi:MAG: alpha-glucosidase [Leptospiraceae bacterium]|nr:alpha-glucosidase [Leptospiraceae bacterium]
MDRDWLWWQHGVIYQIYPRSFYDSNQDGIGDIQGIIDKLDYIQDLGFDAIWISPINSSPMHDFGYDISDYRSIDPLFGTNKEFYDLVKQAHKRKIRIIMDLVVNHSSHQHPWFLESASSRDNPKADWYIWQDPRNGREPNNWLAAFGGKAWQWNAARQQYYLHTHLMEQPDFNWRNPELRKAIFNDIKFWLDKGVDGFRLDVINFLLKDRELRNNPFTFRGPSPRPYDLQAHIYDRNQPENLEIMTELRRLSDQYRDRMLVGEVYAPRPDPQLSASYVGDGRNMLHMAFDFSIIYQKKWHARSFINPVQRWYELLPPQAWPCHVLSNHDQPRSRSRFGGGKENEKRARVAAAFLLTIRGTPFIYYGEELGMYNGKIARSQLQDPVGKKYWPLHPGRDPERTPMLWSNQKNAGFSSQEPWLPLNEGWQSQNVEVQQADPDSLLNFHKRLIHIRKKSKALMQGDWKLEADGSQNYLAYSRTWQKESVLVLLNFDSKTKRIQLTHKRYRALFGTHVIPAQEMRQGPWQLRPYEVLILSIKSD